MKYKANGNEFQLQKEEQREKEWNEINEKQTMTDKGKKEWQQLTLRVRHSRIRETCSRENQRKRKQEMNKF